MKTIAATIFGLAVITSGLMRYFQQPEGEKGLWFGIVFGTLSLIAAFCYSTGKSLFASILTWSSLAFVGGWFVYEALIKKGFANAEWRQLVIIGLTAATAIFYLTATNPRSSENESCRSENSY